MWREEARFKHLSSEDEVEQAGIASFGRSVAAAMLNARSLEVRELAGTSAMAIRESILNAGNPFVSLRELISLCWGVGIPVAHLRVFPWPQKRMAAMTVRVGDRNSILLGKDAGYPAPIAFYLAHELGHIALAHVQADTALIDLDTGDALTLADDQEEAAADAFALELLTGRPRPVVLSADGTASARELARTALSASEELGIEPGTLALCFGYSTQDWRTANASLRYVYGEASPVWAAINAVARAQLQLAASNEDWVAFLETVLDTRDGD